MEPGSTECCFWHLTLARCTLTEAYTPQGVGERQHTLVAVMQGTQAIMVRERTSKFTLWNTEVIIRGIYAKRDIKWAEWTHEKAIKYDNTSNHLRLLWTEWNVIILLLLRFHQFFPSASWPSWFYLGLKRNIPGVSWVISHQWWVWNLQAWNTSPSRHILNYCKSDLMAMCIALCCISYNVG